MGLNASFFSSSTDITKITNSHLPEYAFIGRSNVGKSSLINMLCQNPHLAKTSQRPGKTVLINHFLVNDDMGKQQWFLVDLPGYGFAQASKDQQKKLRMMIDRYLLQSPMLVNTFVLIDSRHKPLTIDTDFMLFLGENNVPFSIVFTKIDKLSKLQLSKNIEQYKETLLMQWEELPPIFLTSSAKKQGRDEILTYINSINLTL